MCGAVSEEQWCHHSATQKEVSEAWKMILLLLNRHEDLSVAVYKNKIQSYSAAGLSELQSELRERVIPAVSNKEASKSKNVFFFLD